MTSSESTVAPGTASTAVPRAWFSATARSSGDGGGLAITAGSTASVYTSLITLNLADGGAKGSGGQNGLGDGGGVYYEAAGGFVDDPYTLIVFNFASTSGNDIFLL